MSISISTLSNIHLSVGSAKKFWAPEGGYGGEGRKGEVGTGRGETGEENPASLIELEEKKN